MTYKRKNVYKVCKTGWVYDDLDSAVAGAVHSLKFCIEQSWGYTYVDSPNYKPKKVRLSAPIVTKRIGGYKVTCVGSDGNTYVRQIDMFKPEVIEGENIPKYEALF